MECCLGARVFCAHSSWTCTSHGFHFGPPQRRRWVEERASPALRNANTIRGRKAISKQNRKVFRSKSGALTISSNPPGNNMPHKRCGYMFRLWVQSTQACEDAVLPVVLTSLSIEMRETWGRKHQAWRSFPFAGSICRPRQDNIFVCTVEEGDRLASPRENPGQGPQVVGCRETSGTSLSRVTTDQSYMLAPDALFSALVACCDKKTGRRVS